MRLISQTDLSGSITRQTLANLWKDASVTEVLASDISADTIEVQVASSLSEANAGPGFMVWSQVDQLMFVYTDVLEDTGVSLWLAIGPDVFETACLAAEPIPAGAAVAPLYDRWVTVADPSTSPANMNRPVCIGVNQSHLPLPARQGDSHKDTMYSEGGTSASETWIRVAIDGYVRACFPAADPGVSEQHFGHSGRFDGVHHVGLLEGLAADGHSFAGLFGAPNNENLRCDNQVAQSCYFVSNYSGMTYSYARVKWGGGYRFQI